MTIDVEPRSSGAPVTHAASPKHGEPWILCLSGGGFRATFFHAGVIRFLREAGALYKTVAVCSVSGGSILAAHMCRNWRAYADLSKPYGEITGDLRKFAASDLRGWILRRRLLLPFLARFSRVRSLESRYDDLFGKASIETLNSSARDQKPNFLILATSMTTGSLCAFTGRGVLIYPIDGGGADCSRTTLLDSRLPSLAFAVAASSAFPPLFPPVRMTLDLLKVSAEKFPHGSDFLTDGGVFDNLGLRAALAFQGGGEHRCGRIVVSDASAPFDWRPDHSFAWAISRTVRTTDILMRRVGLFERRTSGANNTGAVQLTEVSIEDRSTRDEDVIGPDLRGLVSKLRTDLDRFTSLECDLLEYHGFEAAAHSLGPILGKVSIPNPLAEKLAPVKARLGVGLVAKLEESSKRSVGLWNARDYASWILAGLVLAVPCSAAWYVIMTQRTERELGGALGKTQETLVDISKRQQELLKSVGSSDNVREYRSGLKPSGVGKAWSPFYQMCSERFASQHVVRAELFLTGDRACNAWAECRQTVGDPDQVCYEFRLQGHDEWGGDQRGFSEGILRVELAPGPKQSRSTWEDSNPSSPESARAVENTLCEPTSRASGATVENQLQWCASDNGFNEGADCGRTAARSGGFGVGLPDVNDHRLLGNTWTRAQMIEAAKAAAAQGFKERAIDMAVCCQIHNPSSHDCLSRNRPAVLNWLRKP